MQNQCAAPEVAFQQPVEPGVHAVPPGAAVIEILERHNGPKKTFSGLDSMLLPNRMRINGVGIYASYDQPAILHEVQLGPGSQPFRVTVQLLARSVTVGGDPVHNAGAEAGTDGEAGAVVEIPGGYALEPGTDLAVPWVLLNGHRLYVDGSVVIGQLATRGPFQNVATVTLTLLCRQLTVDDEPLGEHQPPA